MLSNLVHNEFYRDFMILTIYQWKDKRIYFNILSNQATSIVSGSYAICSGTKEETEKIQIDLKNKVDGYLKTGDLKEE